MNKLSIISALMLVLVATSALAAVNVNYIFNVNGVESSSYDCLDSSCNSINTFSGSYPNGASTGGSSMIVNYPRIMNPADGYAAFFVSPGFVPMEYRARVFGNGAGNFNVNFYKIPQCSSAIDTFTVTNDAHANVPLVVHTSASLDAITRSAFALTETGVGYVPPQYKDVYYSADTRITLTIRDAAGNVVNQQSQDFTAANGNPLFAGESRAVDFSWTPNVDGVFTATVTTDVIDNQCQTQVPQSASSAFNVLPALPQNQCYTILNGLAAQPFVGTVGQTVALNLNKISNHANNYAFNGDPNYRLTPVATDITYTVNGPAGVVSQSTFTAAANADNSNPTTQGFSFVPTATGMHTVSVTGLANSALCAGLLNTPNTVTLNVNVIAPPTHTIRFQIVDVATGNNIAGATVTVAGQTLTTDANGNAVTGPLSPGDYPYSISANGYDQLNGVAQLRDFDLDIFLGMHRVNSQNGRVTFIVVDQNQAPIANALVSFLGTVSQTNANGNSVYNNVGAGTNNWAVNAAGYNGATGSVTTNGVNDQIVRVVLTSSDVGPHSVTFHVFDAQTNANLAGATVTLTGGSLPPNGIPGVTDANGNVVFASVPQGSYSFFVAHAGYNNANGGVTVGTQDVLVQVPLTRQTQPPVHSVTYHVIDALTGADLPGASVTFNSVAATTNAGGLAIYGNVADGTYPFSVTLAGYNPASGTTAVAGADVVVTVALTRPGTTGNVQFHVYDAQTGANLPGAFVDYQVTNDRRQGTTDVAGNVLFNTIAPGSYPFAVTLAGYNAAAGQATVVVGQTTIVQVALTSNGICTVGHSVTFNVIAANNAQPISGATVQVGTQTGTTNANGVVVFNNVCDGTYTYTVSANGFNSATGIVTVAGSDVSINVELSGNGGPGGNGDQTPEMRIFVGRIRISEIARNAVEAPILITFANDGDTHLDDVRVHAVSTELGLRSALGSFDLGRNDRESQQIILHTDEVTLHPGLYPIRLTISNDDVTRVVYRDLEVLP